MALSDPYGQLHYIGEFANDGAANTFVTDAKWDTNGNGTGTAQKGMQYFDTTSNQMKVWDGSAWSSFDTAGGVSDHGALTGLADDDHSQYHNDVRGDTRYYQKTEFKNSSAGAGDAGKPVVLDAAGHVDESMINDADIDHGNLTGNGDDDHTQYSLAAGTRPFTGTVGGVTPTLDTHLATKGYVDGLVETGVEHQDSVASIFDNTSALPVGPTTGDRYIAQVTANGWTANNIYEWDGAAWVETVVVEGFSCWVDDLNRYYHYTGTAWVKGATIADHNDLNGLQGGQASEYYHLTNAQHSDLTGGGTSTGHDHDDRYGRVYTGASLNPNGSQAGVIGDVYVSTGAVALKYMKTTASGNTGWKVI